MLLNYFNANRLLSTDSFDEVIYFLSSLKTSLVVLTDVDEGMVYLKSGYPTYIPYNQPEEVVDITGGDDGVSGATLVAYCEGKNIYEMGYMANHSRILNVQQFGLPSSIAEYRLRNFLAH